MDTLRSVAHLQREIGDELFALLISSDNTDAVRKFAKTLVNQSILPTEMILGYRTYEILDFVRKEDNNCVTGNMMVSRAKEMNANLGQEDGKYILSCQYGIPAVLRDRVYFVFSDWHYPGDYENVAYVCWRGDRWLQGWRRLDDDWRGHNRVLRRK